MLLKRGITIDRRIKHFSKINIYQRRTNILDIA